MDGVMPRIGRNAKGRWIGVIAIATSAVFLASYDLSAQPTPEVDSPQPAKAAKTAKGNPSELAGATLPTPETMRFFGVRPGASNAEEVRKLWGEPVKTWTDEGGDHWRFTREPFQYVDLDFDDEIVRSVRIAPRKGIAVEPLETQLEITDFEPVERDAEGEARGLSYPERGVFLGYQAQAPGVMDAPAGRIAESGASTAKDATRPLIDEITLGVLDARAFLARAESRRDASPGQALADAKIASGLAPENLPAREITRDLSSMLGQGDDALAQAEAIASREGSDLEDRLIYYRQLANRGRIHEALDLFERIEPGEASPLARVYGLYFEADFALEDSDDRAERAIEIRAEAMDFVRPLLESESESTRRAAIEALLEGLLGTADDIAWGSYRQKEVVVPKWLAKAEQLVEEGIASGILAADWRRRIATRSVAIVAGMRGDYNAEAEVSKALTLGRDAFEKAKDPLTARAIAWELGAAMYHAVRIDLAREEPRSALEHGGLATLYLEKGAVDRQLSGDEAYLWGKLYYHFGSIYVSERSFHEQATQWYDKARPLLTRPLDESRSADIADQGETLVAMAVSYWTVGRARQAIELTELGAGLLERAVNEGLVEREALVIPYANLASMHRKQGNDAAAVEYDGLAKRSETDGSLTR